MAQSCAWQQPVGAHNLATDRRGGQRVSDAPDGRNSPTKGPEEPKLLAPILGTKTVLSAMPSWSVERDLR